MERLVIEYRPIDSPPNFKWERTYIVASVRPDGHRYAILLFGYFASWYRYKGVCRDSCRKILYDLHLVGKVAETLGFRTEAVEFRLCDVDVS